jgi:molecular chaperone DnaK
MPVIRQALISTLGNKLDHSIDPMTVVARGAAYYASTVQRISSHPAPAAAQVKAAPARGTIELKLSHERASGTLQSPVAGVIPKGAEIAQIKIDSQGGAWSSGWVPVHENRFAAEVMLTAGKQVTRFLIIARAANGSAIAISPANFSIAYPLPAEARKTYRVDRTLRQSDYEATLPIKFWEIEVSDDPQEKWWAGCVHIRAEKLRRPLTEGTEIELTVKIDKSRKMTVEVFIPMLNQGFSDDVFVPDPPTTRNQLQQQLDLCFERIGKVYQTIYAAARDDLRDRADAVQFKLEVIAEQLAEEQARGNTDPDALLGPTATLRKVQLVVIQLEEQLESERHLSPFVIKLKSEHRWTGHIVEDHGSAIDKETFARLSGQLERYIESDDQRGLKFISEQLNELQWKILYTQEWYWERIHSFMKQPGRRFVNQNQAGKWLKTADDAAARSDFPALRSALCELDKLCPPDQLETAKEQAMQSGLKGA